jgi:protein phosphatase
MKTSIEVFAQTDVGMMREGNEDSYLVDQTTSADSDALASVQHLSTEHGIILMISDGIGGAAAGEVASLLAVESVRDATQWDGLKDKIALRKMVYDAVQTANDIIVAKAAEHPRLRGMGATATVAGILRDVLVIAQVGDSRGYVIRGNEVVQVTKDQTFVRTLVDAGNITEEEAETHPRRHILLQALAQKEIEIPMTELQLRRGDVLLLCSDGLSGLVGKEDMVKAVSSSSSLNGAAGTLVNLANDRGGPDNITLILARCVGEGFAPAQEKEQITFQTIFEDKTS